LGGSHQGAASKKIGRYVGGSGLAKRDSFTQILKGGGGWVELLREMSSGPRP
jgi:hypothetical protein